jgi:hypothetical protein
MNTNNSSDLHAVLDEYKSDPIKAEGFKSGAYSFSFGKIWRDRIVIGYTNESEEPGAPAILPTSQTSHVEASVFAADIVPAMPEPDEGMPEMGIDSPEGEQSEDPSTGGGATSEEEPPGEEPPGSGQEPFPQEPEGEGGSFAELGKKLGADRGSDEDPLGVTSKFKRPSPKKESIDLINEVRITETRRKLIRSTASVEFDIETKQVFDGELVTLYILPINRGDGKFELYDFRVTKSDSIPSAFAVSKAISSAIIEAIPYVTLNNSQLSQISRRVYSVMKAAKDIAGGEMEESITSAIDRYIREDYAIK